MVGKKDRDALEKILGEADDLYVDALAVAKRRERRLTENMAFFRGYQWGIPMRDGLYDDFADLDPRIEAEVNNFIAGTIQIATSRSFRGPINFSVLAAKEGAIARVRARNSETLARSFIRSGVLPFSEIFDARQASFIHGAAWMKTIWNPFKGPETGSVEQPFAGEIDWQFVSILDALPDPRATTVHNLRHLFHRKFVPILQAEEMWPVDVFGEETAGRFANRGSRSPYELVQHLEVNPDTAVEQMANELAEVIEFWERPSVTYPKGRFVVFCGALLLHVSELPYHWPWDLIQGPNKAPGVLYADGLVHNLKSIQRSINLSASKEREIVNLTLNPPILAEENSNVDEDAITNLAGQVIKFRGPIAPHFMETPGSALGQLQTNQERLQKVFSDVSTFSDAAGGRPPAPGTSARAIAYMAELNDTAHAPGDILFEEAITSATKKGLLLVRDFYDEGRLIRVLGEQNRLSGRSFKRADYDFEVELVVDPFSPRSLSPAVKRAEISENFAAGLFDDNKPGSIAARRLMDLQTEESSVTDIAQAHRRRAEQEDIAFHLIASGDRGIPFPAVLPQDNDDAHLDCHELTFVTEYLSWPEDVQGAFAAHVQQHEQQRAMKLGVYAGEQQTLGGKPAGGPPSGAPSGPPGQSGPAGPESPGDGGHGAPLPEQTAQEGSVFTGGQDGIA